MSATRSLLVSLLLVVTSLVQAQSPTERPQQPAIWIEPATGQQPIRLAAVDIQIQTSGFLARTRIELSFHNPNARVMEGEFVFPLGAGQTVSGYELEVEGRMRQGVVVPKQTARIAFEDISRQQIDPGLAELTRGNVFRTRVYPIPANGNKRVALSFEQVMPADGDSYRYLLPLAFAQSVERFSVRAEAALGAGEPRDVSASPDALLSFDRSGQAWIASIDRQNVQPQRELAFRIPRARDAVDVLEAVDPLEPAWRSVLAQVDSGRPSTLLAVQNPRRIALFFDASGSAAGRDLARERSVLAAYLQGLGNVEVSLVAFRNAAEAPRRIAVRNGDTSAIMTALVALPHDGGSSYGAIDTGLVPNADLILVLGDGLSNFGASEPVIKTNGHPLHVLHAAQQADHAALTRLARRGGGRVIDLLQLDVQAAVANLSRSEWQLLSAETVQGRCAEVLPASQGAQDARVGLSARCEGKATLRLRFGQAGGHSELRELRIGEAAPVEGALAESVRRLHAQARIAELEAASKPDVQAITELGTRYAVVTRHTSLLVLDRIEDYLRYRIEPKEDDLRAQYLARLPALPKPQPDSGKAQRIERLAQLWREFRTWHSTRHAWLETLLQPTAEAEARAWAALARAGTAEQRKRAAAGARDAEQLQAQSKTLAARWTKEGADAAARARWEREASELMQRVDRLRAERLSFAPASTDPGIASDEERLDRIEVTGARIASEAMDQDAVPPPPPSPMPSEALAASPMAMSAPQRAAAPGSGAVRRERGEADGGSQVSDHASSSSSAAEPARIVLSGWNPDTPYMAAIRAATDPYSAYLVERETHGDAPAFFLDAADYFRDQAKRPELALRVLSNIAELDVENTALTRVLAHRLMQWGELELAVGQFEVALEQRAEEPQSYRDLALALARLPKPQLQRAVELLWQVASGEWHGRFPEIELIALHEINDLLAGADQTTRTASLALGIPAELIESLAVGLRVVMSWDADNTDIDLWVTDPAGEQTYYGQNRSKSGGHVSRDFTQGYGPEVYSIARPLPGTYRIRAHYYGDRRQSLTGPVTVQIEFQTDFGSGKSESQSITRRLEGGSKWIELGEFRVGEAP